ncbi:endo alpha-1,4 polygalactosaminidase [Exiguobacterium aurantiacum]|uniref:Endo alpha-1,4 polygalactosaminidase n=1 Tax=Exiguobacterium aurantiacum TaxID=33987 RepID=A0ABY5FP51_9BACL|nr:endo alpha-1,4 polygalactosaminidase [Exiguobacterium aurantiacum]UTT43363.1 endo alpha-1,4 polygalactosaminidase [Exiguobacterium aurantiacum]
MNPLDGVKNYQVYYGHPTEAILKDMQNYDLVIIEPLHYTKAQVEQIKARGTKVLGYISVMEVATWNTGLMSKLQSGDFFTRNGQRVHYSEWDSYLTNIASPHFQGLLLTEIQNQVVAKGIDGVFMDTVGDIDNEHLNNPTVLKQQRDGLVNFLKQARARYGDIAMVQNWGFDTLETSTAPYIDGIMWESFNADTIKSDAWSQNMIKKLQAVDAKYSVKTLTISTRQNAESHKLAKDSGFIHFHEADAYVNWNAGLVTRTKDTAPVAVAPATKPAATTTTKPAETTTTKPAETTTTKPAATTTTKPAATTTTKPAETTTTKPAETAPKTEVSTDKQAESKQKTKAELKQEKKDKKEKKKAKKHAKKHAAKHSSSNDHQAAKGNMCGKVKHKTAGFLNFFKF